MCFDATPSMCALMSRPARVCDLVTAFGAAVYLGRIHESGSAQDGLEEEIAASADQNLRVQQRTPDVPVPWTREQRESMKKSLHRGPAEE